MTLDINNKILSLFNTNFNENYYLESLGFNNKVPVYREFTHLYAKVFFSILLAVFSRSSLLREA